MRPTRFEKKLMGWTLTVGLLGSVLIAQIAADPGVFGDIAHATVGSEDPREEKIRLALEKALGLEVSVHCVPPWDGENIVGRHPKLFGFGLDIVRLQDERCDGATEDINEAYTANALGVLTAAHEGMHIIYDDDNGPDGEPITECRAFQAVPAVAEALGAKPETIERMVDGLSYQVAWGVERYTPPANCIDGGPYDIHPGRVGGAFPRFSPAA